MKKVNNDRDFLHVLYLMTKTHSRWLVNLTDKNIDVENQILLLESPIIFYLPVYERCRLFHSAAK